MEPESTFGACYVTLVKDFILNCSSKLIQATVIKSGRPYLLHVWFPRPSHKGLPSCFQSILYASARYSLDTLTFVEVYLLSLACLVVRPLFVISGSSMFPGVMRGYAQPYCCGSSLPHVRPFWNLYGNIGMMPFNTALVPATSFAVPMYMPAMYGGFPAFR